MGRARRVLRGVACASVALLAACGSVGAPAARVSDTHPLTPSTTRVLPPLTTTIAADADGASSSTAVPATTTGSTAAPTTTTIPPVLRPDVGFSLSYPALGDDDAVLDADMAAITASGAGWVRIDVDWSAIENRQGTFDWRYVDRAVAAASRYHLQVLALLAYTPAWARPANTTDKHPPTDATDMAAFAGVAAARYAARGVTAFEIWNEPNSRNFWQPRPSAQAYAALLTTVAPAVRAAAPGAVIVSGGLAPAIDASNGSEISPVTFLERVLAAGGGDHLDAVGVHPYSYPALPSDQSTSAWNTFVRLPLVHQVLTDAGLDDRPLWLTEVGAPTGTHSRAVDEARQAEIVVDAIATARTLPWVQRTFVFTQRDSGDNAGDIESQFGLRRYDGTPKPAYDALTTLLHG